ncbi:MAG: NAD(P)H-hydrate dehydratase [Legionellaceae bacterium]|nr:NAD(P)H-hydrate dehydratase [Legionellaceae bacterium]
MISQLLYSIERIREAEKTAIEQAEMSEWLLMQRAAQAAFARIQLYYPDLPSLAVFCGAGNNGGDGLLLAALAQANGIATQVYLAKGVEKLAGNVSKAAKAAINAGIVLAPLVAYPQVQADLLVDALLGIGIKGAVHGKTAEVIGWLNAQPVPVVSLDVPSGLDANTGEVLGMAVKATHTISFIGAKTGLYTADGPDHAGEIFVASLELDTVLQRIQPTAKLVTSTTIRTDLPPRAKNCHKGHFGHVLLIGGGRGMPGAIMLAAKAALRVGAGLVTVATRKEHVGAVAAWLPEAMCHGISYAHALNPLLKKATVLVIGPGMGTDRWAQALYKKAICWPGLKVVDASALAMLAASPSQDNQRVLTPHPGEAALLLQTSGAAVQQDRLAALQELHQHYGGTIVLKGCGSLIAANNHLPYLCAAGNPGMATGGTGDVLSGVIAGLMAQGQSPFNAAALGVFVHAKAADRAALLQGVRGLLASDLIDYLAKVVNPEPMRNH